MAGVSYNYRCFSCNKIREYKEGEPVPICCDGPMTVEHLSPCTSAPNPEMARTVDADEPCDDGRGEGQE
ncbi:MAG: hypothetical protein E4G96_10460 [Chrysiogenales bacterium]|nr:MAG: hypothetical protein E4G96_10460 [Chrysiogenales bacterium]